MPGARAWSSGNASSGDGGDNAGHTQNYTELFSGGIRTESRYVFPDGSVRRALDTAGSASSGGRGRSDEQAVRKRGGGELGGRSGGKLSDSGVPMPLIGTSRIGSADLSTSLGIGALDGAGGGINETSSQWRRTNTSNTHSGGAYRGPGAAPGAEWAPGGRPPRAYVPFLNLPASDSKEGSHKRRSSRRQEGSSASGRESLSLPCAYSGRVRRGRGRPLAGIDGVPVSPGRAMLTGPGRPGTGTSGSSSRILGDTGRKNGRRRQHRRGGVNPRVDGESSDGSESVGSGSTDVEFLRRRAEAKLRSLERREAADQTAGGSRGNLTCTRTVVGDGGVVDIWAPVAKNAFNTPYACVSCCGVYVSDGGWAS